MRLSILSVFLVLLLAASPAHATISFEPGTYDLEILEENAGFAPLNQLLWYPADDPATVYSIFLGSDTARATATIYPTTDFGFALFSPAGQFYTNPAFNSDSPLFNHFLFDVPPGTARVEDLPFLGDADFFHCGTVDGPDFFFSFERRPDVVPEPATVSLVGAGLLLAGGIRRYRKQ